MVLEMLVRVLRQSVDACRSEQLSRASKKWLVDSNAALEDRVYLTMNISVVSLPTSGLNSTGNSGSYLNGQNMTPDGQFAIFHSHASDLGVNDTNSKKDVYWKNLATGETRLVSSSSTGIQSNGDSTPDAISDNGRYVVFHSNATNLDPADADTIWDVYLKDMVTGQLTLVSTSSTGVKGNQNCISSSENTPEGPQYLSGADVSGDGRFVVFDSRATNLVSGDSNGQSDVFLKDLLTGQTSSATNAFGGIPSGGSFLPRITPDAKWAFFLSWSGDIVSGDSNGTWDLFRKNLTTGETLCVSTNEFGQIGNGESAWDYDFSPDGNLVVFTSTSSNLVGGDSNGTRDAFLKNLTTGSIRRISTDSLGQQVNATFWINQNMTFDSRYVVLWSPDSGVVSNDTNGTDDVFLKDTVTGSMIRISRTQAGGETNGPSYHGNISDDGRRVIFQSLSSNIVSGDNNANVDVFMWQNTPPVAANDSFSTAANTPVVGVSSLIVSNDTDVDGQILQPVLISGPLHGSILVQSDGSWIYQPNAGYSGSDQFTYKASDGPDLGNLATVSIVIQNNNPTNLTLSNSSVPENNAIGTSVGTLGTSDPDLGNTFTYSLVSGSGSTDNASFNIVGNVLKTSAVFDFETKSSYSIRLRTTDQGGLWFEKAFTVLVTNSNETPTNISLSNSTVSENSAIGTSVGTLDSSDPDLGNSFSYSLVAGNGSTDNGSFNIVGNVLKTASVINFEAKSSYSIRIRTTDQNGSSYEKVFSLTATNTNDAPELSDAGSPMLDAIAQDISDSANTGTLVSTIISRMLPNGGITDEDTGALNGIAINGLTGTSNGSWQFSINNGVTWSAVATTGNANARLLASDANTRIRYVPNTGFSGQASFAFVAWDRTSGANGGVANASSRGGTTPFSVIYDYASIIVNAPPSNVVLSNSNVPENSAVGTSVGTLSTSDPDLGNTFTYSLVSGSGSTDNASFNIVGNVLKTSAVFDFETKSSYSIRLRTTDQGGLWFEKAFTVLVTNVTEALVRTSVATFRGGYWYLDSNDSRSWNGVSGGDSLFGFGSATDIPITGDWNGDGQTDVGVFRGGKFYLDANGNRKWNNTTGGDAFFGFGAVTDIPVAGDWNNDGLTDVGVFRSGKFYLDANGNRKWDGVSGGDALFGFGSATDTPVTGDWNGDGQTDVGVFRKGTFYLDANGNRKWDGGFPNDSYFGFGSASDLPLTGDWNGDGITDIGVYRSGKFYLDANGNRQWDGGFPNDTLFGFGAGADIPVSGFWVNPLSSASSAPSQSLISDRLKASASAAPSSTSDVLGTTDFTRLRSKKSALIAQKHKGTSKLVSNRTLDEFFSGELTGIA